MTSTVQLTNDHQQQQQIYMMYQENPSIDMDSTQMDFDGQVSHTTQAAPITVNTDILLFFFPIKTIKYYKFFRFNG